MKQCTGVYYKVLFWLFSVAVVDNLFTPPNNTDPNFYLLLTQ